MKKRLLKILAVIFIIAVAFGSLLTCGKSQASTEEYDYLTHGILKNYDDFSIFVDEETGVNYIVYHGYRKGGITPRYNADGTLYVSEMEGEEYK